MCVRGKKTNRANVDGYRPISLLCCVSKILEALILNKLNIFCRERDVIPEFQYGFRNKHSTIHPLLGLHSDIVLGLNKKETTVACLLDIEKAFDTVWIKGLVFKLSVLGLPNFLVNKNESSTKVIGAGVPQGSRLGPLLFNIYTADQPANTSGTRTKLYADDSITYATSLSPEIAARKVQVHIKNLWDYYLKWGLKINSNKTELICFRTPVTASRGRRAFATRCDSISIKLPDNSAVAVTNSSKYLGINFTNKLKFKKHADLMLKRANFSLHLVHPLLRKRNGLSKKTKLLVYKQLVRPVLTYAFPIWFTISPTAMKKIKLFERKLLRICTGLYRNPVTKKFIPTTRLYEEAKLIPIDQYMLQLAAKIISNLEHHPNLEVQQLHHQQLDPEHRYLNARAIIDDQYKDIIHNNEAPFYERNNHQHYRG